MTHCLFSLAISNSKQRASANIKLTTREMTTGGIPLIISQLTSTIITLLQQWEEFLLGRLKMWIVCEGRTELFVSNEMGLSPGMSLLSSTSQQRAGDLDINTMIILYSIIGSWLRKEFAKVRNNWRAPVCTQETEECCWYYLDMRNGINRMLYIVHVLPYQCRDIW